MVINVDDVIAELTRVAHVHPRDFSIYVPLSSYRVDSLDLLSAVMGIEELYDIAIPDSVLPTLKCGKDVISYLEAL
jgi:acyl carrier protein